MSTKSLAVVMSAGFSACAAAGILQLDINGLGGQSIGATGGPAAFGGVNHTGAVQLSSNANSAFVEMLLNSVGQNIAPASCSRSPASSIW